MAKHRYQYSVDNESFEDGFEFETDWSEKCLKYIAEDAAQDYHGNHDGWECHWPIEFTIYKTDG